MVENPDTSDIRIRNIGFLSGSALKIGLFYVAI